MLVSTSTLGGHVDTIGSKDEPGRRRRRLHSDEFKADAVAAAAQPGMSTAAVAMARGINANLLRRWVRDAEVLPVKALPNPVPTLQNGIEASNTTAQGFLPRDRPGQSSAESQVASQAFGFCAAAIAMRQRPVEANAAITASGTNVAAMHLAPAGRLGVRPL